MILKNVKDAICFATKEFTQQKLCFGHGIDNAWDEAVYLVLYALSLPLTSNKTILRKRLTVKEQNLVLNIINRRIKERLPASYLTQEAWFAGFKFFVDKRVIIPRSPLGELIVNRFVPWVKLSRVKHILDIGTGSGCIAISCAKVFPHVKVDATDISLEALEVANKNCKKHKVTRRVNIIQADLFDYSQRNKKYDIIISNPPYVGTREMRHLPQEYAYEPRSALLSGNKGHEIVIKIIENAASHLTKHGILIVEVGNSAKLVMQRYPRLPFVWLDFAAGEGEVFLLTKDCLHNL